MKSTIVLIHSPLVGPFTWSLVAQELRSRNIEVVVPILFDSENNSVPFWKQYPDAVAQQVKSVPVDRPVNLIVHSGAGALLPVIRQAIHHPIDSYIFVDAGIPKNGASYLDLLAEKFPEQQVEQFRQMLTAGGEYPNWDDEMLRTEIPDSERRKLMLAELHPRKLAFFEESIPVFDNWANAPCYYLQLSAAYAKSAEQARKKGWSVSEINAGHFHMLVDPETVADAILQLLSHPIT